METNLQNSLRNMIPGPPFEPDMTFTASVMNRIRARARRRRIASGIAIGVAAAAIIGLCAFTLGRIFTTIWLPVIPPMLIAACGVMTLICGVMMFGYERLLNRAISNHKKSAPDK